MAQRLPFHSAGGTTLNTVSSCVTVLLSVTLPKLYFFIYTGEQDSTMLLDYKTLFLVHPLLTLKCFFLSKPLNMLCLRFIYCFNLIVLDSEGVCVYI